MPNDEYYFYANLNFIFNYNEANKTILDRNKSCHDKIGFIQNKTKTTASKVRTLQFNDSLKTQVLRQITNIDTVITGFSKKIRNSYDTILFVKKEANKLSSSKEPIGIKFKKSQILFEKLTNKHSQIDMIERILFSMEKHLNSITLNGNILKPSLDKILDILKKCLKETEEYNISKLKRAQQQFEKSKELNDFMYGKRNPKLAHLLSLDSSVPVDSATPSKLMTPFGPVWVKRSNSDSSRMIYLIYLNQQCSKNLKYDEMCEQLDLYDDEYEQEYDRDGLIKLFSGKLEYSLDDMIHTIDVIIKYINQPLDKDQNFLGTKKNFSSPQYLFSFIKHGWPISKKLNPKQKEAAAFLCGVLLLSESHEFRNPTGGKFERKAMKNVLRLAKNGCINPFSKVFSNAKGRYIPAHNKSENEAKTFPGGQRQASILINLHEINIRYFLTNSDFDEKKKDAMADEFERDFIEQIKKFGEIEKLSKDTLKTLREGKTPKAILNNANLEKIKVDINKGFLFIKKFKNANKTTTFDIKELPDKPNSSFLAKLKIITKTKNIKRMNKLMNNSI